MRIKGVGTLVVLAILSGVLIGLLLNGCTEMPESNPTLKEEGGQVWDLQWVPISPPEPGMRCWVAWWDIQNADEWHDAVAVGFCVKEDQ